MKKIKKIKQSNLLRTYENAKNKDKDKKMKAKERKVENIKQREKILF